MPRLGFFLLTIVTLAVAAFGLASGSSAADSGAAAAQESKAVAVKRDTKAKKLGVTPERQAAVMTFVQRNHAELAELLTHLKSRQPAEYEGAVREIFRTTERLAQIQERDPSQYELEVTLWTAQSRVQLLAARLMMGATDELQTSLRAAVGAQIDARAALLQHQRQKAADRLANLDREIAKAEDDREQAIERQIKLLTRAASESSSTSIVPKNATPKNGAKSVKKAKAAGE